MENLTLGKKMVLLLAILVLIAVLAIGIFLIMKKNRQPDLSAPQNDLPIRITAEQIEKQKKEMEELNKAMPRSQEETKASDSDAVEQQAIQDPAVKQADELEALSQEAKSISDFSQTIQESGTRPSETPRDSIAGKLEKLDKLNKQAK